MYKRQDVFSINPVVGECNDSSINEIGNRVVGEKEPYQAMEQADTDFAEGAVGAGTGTICYGPVSYTHLDVYKRQTPVSP